MTVYVDDMKWPYRGMIMSHMTADTVDELHAMADKIGLKRKWFQKKSIPHYDICQSKRSEAITNGVISETTKQFVRRIKRDKA